MAKVENIDWIFFDMGGVILDDAVPEIKRQEAVLTLAREFKPELTMHDVRNSWMEASKLPGSVRVETMRIVLNNEDQFNSLEEKIKHFLPQGSYFELSAVRPEAKSILKTLSATYDLGIIANQASRITEKLISADILRYFSHQKMSAHHGLEKPDPEYFKAVLNDTKADPKRSVLVDDNWFRGLLPAQNLGMTTVLFKRDCMPYPEDANPDYAIQNLSELQSIFI